MALLNYLIWKGNGLYYQQSWLQEKRSSSNILCLFMIRSKRRVFFSLQFHPHAPTEQDWGVFLFHFVLKLFNSPFFTCHHWLELCYGNPCVSSFKFSQYLLCFFLIHTVAKEKVSDGEFRFLSKAVMVHSNFICRYYSESENLFVGLVQNHYYTQISSVFASLQYFFVSYLKYMSVHVCVRVHTHMHRHACNRNSIQLPR